MSIDSFRAIRLVQKQLKLLSEHRISNREPQDYPSTKEGMIELHTQWQSLMSAVRANNISGNAANAAILLAATAIKFASDLGDASDMGLSVEIIKESLPYVKTKKAPLRLTNAIPEIRSSRTRNKKGSGKAKREPVSLTEEH